MVSIVSAVRPPQRWPGDSGVGGALVQSHLCRAPVGGGGTRMHYVYTPVGVQQTGKIDELCVCVRACVRACVYMAHPHLCTHRAHHTTHLHGMLQVPGGCTEAVEGVVLPNRVDPLTATIKVTSTALARSVVQTI